MSDALGLCNLLVNWKKLLHTTNASSTQIFLRAEAFFLAQVNDPLLMLRYDSLWMGHIYVDSLQKNTRASSI
jgi:hypothetical protein